MATRFRKVKHLSEHTGRSVPLMVVSGLWNLMPCPQEWQPQWVCHCPVLHEVLWHSDNFFWCATHVEDVPPRSLANSTSSFGRDRACAICTIMGCMDGVGWPGVFTGLGE